MRTLLIFLVGCTMAAAATPIDRAIHLEAIKRDFPAHVAGPMSEKTNPSIAILYFGYKKLVAELRINELDFQFERLRQRMIHDLEMTQTAKLIDAQQPDPEIDAMRQNEVWLRTKVRPWMLRVEKLIVGNQ